MEQYIRRYVWMLFIAPFVFIMLIVSFIVWSGFIGDFSKYGQNIASLILAFLELLLIVAFMILLHQYFRDHRPHRFFFDGFCNEADVLKSEQKPVNLSKLAQEELANQFQELYDQMAQYSELYDQQAQYSELYDQQAQYSDSSQDPVVVLPNIEKSSSLNIGIYLPALKDEDKSIKQAVDVLVEELQDIVNTLGGPIDASSNALENIAPQGVGPIMPLIDTLVAPDVFKVTGYLQYKNDEVGITLELASPRYRKPLIHTFWQKRKHTSLPVKPQSPDSPNDDWLVTDYITLLGPSMRWLMLQIWEKDISQRKVKGGGTGKEQKEAVMLCLLGAIYYASADQFEEHKRFFLQSAASCFQKAMTKQHEQISWWVPYLYLANIYRFEMQSIPGRTHEIMFDKAQTYYDYALKYTEDKMIKDRILVDRAITTLIFRSDEQIINPKIQCVRQVMDDVNPYYFDESRADNTIFLLYSLATWCQIVFDKYAKVEAKIDEPADKCALYYLAAALVHSRHPFSHSEYLWETANIDQNFKSMRKEGYLKELKEKLNTELEDLKVAKWKKEDKGNPEDFKKLINDVVEKVYNQ